MQDISGGCEATEALEPDITFVLSLDALNSTDIGLVRSWQRDTQNDLISDAEQVRWFNDQSVDPKTKMYKIMLSRSTGEKPIPIGLGGFTSIDITHRRAEFSLCVAQELRSCGFERKALPLLLDHGFKNLGFNTIRADVFEDRDLDGFVDAGFCVDGLKRDFYFRDGRFIDAHTISMKADEWI